MLYCAALWQTTTDTQHDTRDTHDTSGEEEERNISKRIGTGKEEEKEEEAEEERKRERKRKKGEK